MEIEKKATPKHEAERLSAEFELDIREPGKWLTKLRLFLEELDGAQADGWMQEFRTVYEVAGRVIRDRIYGYVTARCFVCGKRFKEGRPAVDGGYFDADRTYIKVYACDQSEYSALLGKCHEKEEAVAAQAERADKAARQAAQEARRAANAKEIRP